MYLTHLNIAHYVHKALLQNLVHFSLHNTTRRTHFKEQKTEVQKSRDCPKSSDLYVLNLEPEPMFLYPQRGGLMMFMKYKTFKSSLDVKIK